MVRRFKRKNNLHSLVAVPKKKNNIGGLERNISASKYGDDGTSRGNDGELDMRDQSISPPHHNERNTEFYRKKINGAKRGNDNGDIHNQSNNITNDPNTKTTYQGNARPILKPKSILRRSQNNANTGKPVIPKNPFATGFSPMAQQSSPYTPGSSSMTQQGNNTFEHGSPIMQNEKKVRFIHDSRPNINQSSFHRPKKNVPNNKHHWNNKHFNSNRGGRGAYKGRANTRQFNQYSQTRQVHRHSTSPANTYQVDQQSDATSARCNCYRCVQEWKHVSSRLDSFERQVSKSWEVKKNQTIRGNAKLVTPV
ncbi:hypothetical protein N7495_004062 [Penicillium taxi]|uniref:uncharacterized protein n=1 Tax=Penicillium taxi TaxID=168475 RepID=UPI002545B25F|nr:uncharacterized protein N7495_004062 [Penicillium taxi]KAJ5899318.1 hypothetical protein N7495_004062 [Penicillium taxi]